MFLSQCDVFLCAYQVESEQDGEVIGYVSVLESGTMQKEADAAADKMKRKASKQVCTRYCSCRCCCCWASAGANPVFCFVGVVAVFCWCCGCVLLVLWLFFVGVVAVVCLWW